MSLVNVHTFLHTGIPVNDLERAKDFYMNVLGLKESNDYDYGPNSPVRLYCGQEAAPGQQVVLFKRPAPIERDAVAEDGYTHHAFVVTPEEFDLAMEKFQEMGIFRRGPITWPGTTHRTLYFHDPDGNNLELAD